MSDNVTRDGNLVTNGTIEIATLGCVLLSLEVGGDWVGHGSVYLEGTYGSSWDLVETLVANEHKAVNTAGYRRMRLRADVADTFTVNYWLTAGDGAAVGGGGGGGVVDQGKAGAEKWLTADTDSKGVLDTIFARLADGNQKTQLSGTPSVSVSNLPASQLVTAANLDVALSTVAKATTQTDGTQKTQIVNGANTMPAGDAAARALYMRQTDGTNTAPTMDTVARRGFVTHTDGTNSMPTGDAVTRGIHVRMGDGTTVTAVKAASTAPVATDPATVVTISPNGQKVQVVDASGNVHPAGDTAARAIFFKPTDGTNTPAVKAASTAPVATDAATVVTLSPNSAGVKLTDATFNFGQRLFPGLGQGLGTRVLDFGDKFDGITTDTLLWISDVSSGTAGQGNTGFGTAQSFGSANSYGKLKSALRYQPVSGSVAVFHAIMNRSGAPAGVTTGHQLYFGPFDDAAFQGWKVALIAGVWTVGRGDNSGSFTFGAINGTAPAVDILPHLYEVIWAGGSVYFLCDGVVFHTAAQTAYYYQSLPLAFQAINTTGSAVNGAWNIIDCGFSRYGGDGSRRWRSFRQTANGTQMLKPGSGELGRLIVTGVGTTQTVQFFDYSGGGGTALTGVISLTAGMTLDLVGLRAEKGISMVTTAAAGTPDLLITWR